MFGRKKKAKQKETGILVLIDRQGEIVYEGDIFLLPIEEACILEQCIHFYNDHNPCHIHKTAVMNRLRFELEEYFKNHRISSFLWESLPERIRYILQGKNIKGGDIKWENPASRLSNK